MVGSLSILSKCESYLGPAALLYANRQRSKIADSWIVRNGYESVVSDGNRNLINLHVVISGFPVVVGILKDQRDDVEMSKLRTPIKKTGVNDGLRA
ncbi:hypothetical protein YC2023_057310 [Brassica napus]